MSNGNGELTPMLQALKDIVEKGEDVEPMVAIKLLLGVSWATYNTSCSNHKELATMKRTITVVGAVAFLALVIVSAHAQVPDFLKALLAVP
jgi:hypothetical protein